MAASARRTGSVLITSLVTVLSGVVFSTLKMDFAYAQERLKKPDIPWATFVGLIPKVPTGGMRSDSCPFEVGIYEDDEDDDNNNQLWFQSQNLSGHNASVGGFVHTISRRRAGGNSVVNYCQEPVSYLPQTRLGYAVIAAQTWGSPSGECGNEGWEHPVCPHGTHLFTRYFDNEDSNNRNKTFPANSDQHLPTYTWDDNPNPRALGICYQQPDGASRINFCYVPPDPNAEDLLPTFTWVWNVEKNEWIWKNIGEQYLFLTINTPQRGQFYQDDEDDDNNNYWEYPESSAPFKSAMNAIIGDTRSFTNWHFGWTGMTPAVVDMGTERSCGNTPNLVPPLCDPLSNPQCATEWGKYAWTAGKFAFCWL